MPIDPWRGLNQGIQTLGNAAQFRASQQQQQFNNAATGQQLGMERERLDAEKGQTSKADARAKVEDALKQLKFGWVILKGIESAPPEQKEAAYQAARQKTAEIFGPQGAEKWPPAYDENWFMQQKNLTAGMFEKTKEQLTKLSQGDVLVNEQGETVASNPKPPTEKGPIAAGGKVYDPNTKTWSVPPADAEEYKPVEMFKLVDGRKVTKKPRTQSEENFFKKQGYESGDVTEAPASTTADSDDKIPAKVKSAQDMLKQLASGNKDDALSMAIQALAGGQPGAGQEVRQNIPEELKPLYEASIKIMEEYYGIEKQQQKAPAGVQTATNPKTNQKVYFDGEEWIPMP